jgi:hypothetical protein
MPNATLSFPSMRVNAKKKEALSFDAKLPSFPSLLLSSSTFEVFVRHALPIPMLEHTFRCETKKKPPH